MPTQLERWLSGRKRTLGKRVCPSSGTEGSNPSLSVGMLLQLSSRGVALALPRFFPLALCAVSIVACPPRKHRIRFEPPQHNESPERKELNNTRLLLGDSFTQVLPRTESEDHRWEVIWNKKLLKGNSTQDRVCLNTDFCLNVIKYEFHALQIGTTQVEFQLKQKNNVVESFIRHVVVTKADLPNSAR